MVLEESSHLYISANQKDERYFLHNKTPYSYSFIRFMIGKKGKDFEFISAQHLNSRNLTLENHFLPGEYYLVVNVDWCQEIVRSIVIS